MISPKKINVEFVPHSSQNYDTCGDYGIDENGDWWIKVSELGHPMYNLAVSLHEITEFALTQYRGISEESITKFDIDFEKNRPIGFTGECGDNPNAPYKLEHRFAENIERQFILESGLDWFAYDKKMQSV